ncbi:MULTISPECIES: hypothetical protein [unclassified Pseudomonas]|uniref:hypothetical protein n=1 Tax=unclassified Pseudomonas TaxID=196821 RepID=UPI0021C6395B|nr:MULTISPECIES: hypothetical protein [unclassified Pseudomonas]MCU1731034.1 hypothetical protein [Pseudomonas sp. 20P_3.2_Bac4]MCU1742757.1 hypothetical protein [Pseudomonas sp. 20P_3.2_Bac5]
MGKAGVASLQWTVALLSAVSLRGAGAMMKKGAMVPVLAAAGKPYLVAAMVGNTWLEVWLRFLVAPFLRCDFAKVLPVIGYGAPISNCKWVFQ